MTPEERSEALKELVSNIKRDEREGVAIPSILDENGNRMLELTPLNPEEN